MDWSAIYMREVFASGPLPRRARGGDLRLLPGGDALLRRRLRRPALAEHGGARAPLRDDGGGAPGLLLARALRLAPRLRAARRRDERDLPAGDLGRGAAHRPAGRDQRRGAGADLLRHLPARPAAPRLRGAALGDPLVVRHRAAARRASAWRWPARSAASIGPAQARGRNRTQRSVLAHDPRSPSPVSPAAIPRARRRQQEPSPRRAAVAARRPCVHGRRQQFERQLRQVERARTAPPGGFAMEFGRPGGATTACNAPARSTRSAFVRDQLG